MLMPGSTAMENGSVSVPDSTFFVDLDFANICERLGKRLKARDEIVAATHLEFADRALSFIKN